MEFRWLTTEKQRSRAVESHTLSDVLALAQQLQAEAEGQVTDDQVVEMGRELGVQPEYIREALRLRRRPVASRVAPSQHPGLIDTSPSGSSLGRALTMGLGLGTLPMALIALADSHAQPVAFFTLIATLAAGWAARQPRLAGTAGMVTAPLIVLVSAMFLTSIPVYGLRPEAFFISLLSFTALGGGISRFAAGLRDRLERLGERPPLPASHH
jgi:hypothetical protein